MLPAVKDALQCLQFLLTGGARKELKYRLVLSGVGRFLVLGGEGEAPPGKIIIGAQFILG